MADLAILCHNGVIKSVFYDKGVTHMTKVISIDAFGGDKGPKVVLGGINQFLYQNGEGSVHFRIFGKQSTLNKLLAKFPRVMRNCTVIDAPDVIRGTDKVRDVIRHADGTSMFMAIKDVRAGNSSAVVSAGNTGVLMSLSKLALRPLMVYRVRR